MRWPLRHPRFIPPHENRPGHVPGSGDGSASGSQPLIERILLHPLVHALMTPGAAMTVPKQLGPEPAGKVPANRFTPGITPRQERHTDAGG